MRTPYVLYKGNSEKRPDLNALKNYNLVQIPIKNVPIYPLSLKFYTLF